jgi:hypothetical protein
MRQALARAARTRRRRFNMYQVEITINGEEGELLLELLAGLTAMHKEGLESIVEVSVRKIEAEDEQQDYPHCRHRYAP